MVILVTGPSGAGKTTVASLLAASFDRGVHLEGDVFRRSIVSGRIEMTPGAAAEALAQLRLRYRAAAAAAEEYRRAGYTVVVEDVAAGELLAEYVAMFREPPHVFVLMPSRETVRERDAARATSGYGNYPADALYDLFAQDTPRIGHWLDTSGQTPAESVTAISATLAAARRAGPSYALDP